MKKILAIALALLMVLSLAACGSSVDPTAQLTEIQKTLADIQSKLNSLEAAAPAAAEEPADEAEPAAEEPADEPAVEVTNTDTLKIGLLIHQTGGFAGVDTPNYNEFNAMIDYINNDLGGWVVGDTLYTLEAVCVDGQTDPTALITAATSLVDAGVKFVVETNDFWVNACASVFEEEGVFHASAYCTSNTAGYLIPENPLAFTGSNGTLGDLQATFAALKEYYPDVHTIAYANDDNGSNEATYELITEVAEANGFETVGMIAYPMDNIDYVSYAQQLVDFGADCFLGNGTPEAYGSLLKEIRALGDDMVMACMQAKPVSMFITYAGEDVSYNGFTLGVSTREDDQARNTDVCNDLVQVVRENYGDDSAATFDGAAANTLYVMLQMMQRAGVADPEAVAAAWEAGGEVETIYGTGVIGGTETYGVTNHAIGHPRAISMMDPEAEGGWYFADWIDVQVP